MIIVDELYQNASFEIPLNELVSIMQSMKEKKEEEIEGLKKKITKYEQKRRAEEALYQSLSPFRRFFTGRPPSHHQAVEYIVHVKQRLKRIEKIKQRIRELDEVMHSLQGDFQKNEIVLSTEIIEELKVIKEGGQQL